MKGEIVQWRNLLNKFNDALTLAENFYKLPKSKVKIIMNGALRLLRDIMHRIYAKKVIIFIFIGSLYDVP